MLWACLVQGFPGKWLSRRQEHLKALQLLPCLVYGSAAHTALSDDVVHMLAAIWLDDSGSSVDHNDCLTVMRSLSLTDS